MATAIVLLLVAAALIAAVCYLRGQKKAGCHGSCHGCVYSESCKSKDF